MKSPRPRAKAFQGGMVLISAMLLLLVMTIFAISMFRSFGIQERIAANLREKQRALHAAETAEQYGEWWLTQGGNSSSLAIVCNSQLDANLNEGQICSNQPTSFASVPWQINGASVGVNYTPSGMTISSTGGVGNYYTAPDFYITDMGKSASGTGEIYQVDAMGYGTDQNTVAVVESTYSVSTTVTCLSCSP